MRTHTIKPMSEKTKAYHKAATQLEAAVESQLFGKPCYKINGKAFCCFFNDDMVFKLTGTAHSEALSLDGSQLFDPSGKGRPMKQWVQVPFDYAEKWADFAELAASYIQEKG